MIFILALSSRGKTRGEFLASNGEDWVFPEALKTNDQDSILTFSCASIDFSSFLTKNLFESFIKQIQKCESSYEGISAVAGSLLGCIAAKASDAENELMNFVEGDPTGIFHRYRAHCFELFAGTRLGDLLTARNEVTTTE